MTAQTIPARRARRIRLARAVTVPAAAGTALATWAVLGPLAGVRLAVHSGGATREIGPIAVAATASLAALLGWALLAVLERLTRGARAIWTVAAVLVLLASMVGPLGGVDTASRLDLAGLHLLVGAVVIGGLDRSTRRC